MGLIQRNIKSTRFLTKGCEKCNTRGNMDANIFSYDLIYYTNYVKILKIPLLYKNVTSRNQRNDKATEDYRTVNMKLFRLLSVTDILLRNCQ